ncbi:MAG: GGDEF domain-containing protein [Eubacteriales bacterium]|nr:GGDEF domain-containing protein [Eubacteriales bacterium]
MRPKEHSEQYQRPFIADLSKVNVQRIKAASGSLVVLVMAIAPSFFFLKKEEWRYFPINCYLGLLVLLFVLMSVSLIYYCVIGKTPQKNAGLIQFGAVSLMFFFLAWSGAISLLDQFSSGHVTIYSAGIMLSALIFYLSPKIVIPVCLVMHSLFLLGMFMVQDSADLRLSNTLLSTAILFVSLLTSWNNYNGRLDYFRRRAQIEKKNQQLLKLNRELELANQELEKRSATDALTGLNNRRMFEEAMRKEWERCRRYSITLSVIMLDVDHFKYFNDHYGHQTGDYCLHQIGTLLARTVRFASDIVARYGGEEFIIALPYTDSEKAAALAERIRSEVERLKIKHEASAVSDHVTVSIGVSTTIPSEETSSDELIYAADMALYEAKDKNRNCVIAVEV